MEDYKKKYEDLITSLKKAKNDELVCDDRFGAVIDNIVPELKESEDEKWIPKEIAKYLKEKGDFRSCWIAWLEKQGEKKGCAENTTTVNDVVSAYTDEYGKRWVHVCAGDIDFLLDTKDLTFKEVDWNTANKLAANLGMRLNHKREFQLIAPFVDEINQCCVDCGGEPLRGWYWAGDECNDRYAYLFSAASGDLGSVGKVYTYWFRGSKNFKERVQPQPKQEWSEEDEKMLQNLLECLKNGWTKLPTDVLKYESWLKSLKPHSKQEWSEGDEAAYNKALDAYYYKDCNDKDDVVFALKDLIDLIKKHRKAIPVYQRWKPSDEQMTALRRMKAAIAGEGEIYKPLNSLYEDLKKLMEE